MVQFVVSFKAKGKIDDDDGVAPVPPPRKSSIEKSYEWNSENGNSVSMQSRFNKSKCSPSAQIAASIKDCN